ncbi:DNA polymerase III subunit delta [SAR202 cluster bacterium AD-804-J14_MRT_500m]|nr:DNA polymerase III subunit delta [SAR202 cluster bacterium AD-804-J14_MRT_500m]
MSVHVLHGDSFLVQESLKEKYAEIGPLDVVDSNSHRYQADQIKLEDLRVVCAALPFLASMRLVVVEGLMSEIEEVRFRSRGKRRDPKRFSGWDGIVDVIQELPPTTSLVFVDGVVRPDNKLLALIKPHAVVRTLPTPKRDELSRWVRDRVRMRATKITPGAVQLLSHHIGPNLRLLDLELEKLSLFASDRPIEERDVEELVPQVRDISIFVAVDAILEGRSGTALLALSQLRRSGANLSYILAMVARQLRLITLAKEMLSSGMATRELGSRLEIRAEFALKKTIEQAKKFTWERLKILYESLLEMDLAVKEGRMAEDIAIELMVGTSLVEQ